MNQTVNLHLKALGATASILVVTVGLVALSVAPWWIASAVVSAIGIGIVYTLVYMMFSQL